MMNGVSRFLSRRDKHHEKRPSKDARHKVRLPQLPSVLPSSVYDSLSFLYKKKSCRASFTSSIIKTSTTTSSDYLLLQTRPPQVSSDLYKIFTNEDPKTTPDKDVEKKVRHQPQLHATMLIGPRSRCSLPDCRAPAS